MTTSFRLFPGTDLPEDIVHFSVTMRRRDGRVTTITGMVTGFEGSVEFAGPTLIEVPDGVNYWSEAGPGAAEFSFRGAFPDPSVADRSQRYWERRNG